jgi:NAD(P)-dependent dehydrogenase (short-subunit alcohol dehydrogenase family)
VSTPDGIVVVTGGTAGIGLAACRALVARGASVLLTGRDVARGERVRAELAASGGDVRFAKLDLESFADVRSFAADVKSRFPKLRALVHNAGAVYPDRRVTVDGNEAQLQIIHLAPFLLNALLRDHLVDGARVVNVVSALHKNGAALDDWDATSWPRFVPLIGSVRSYARAELFKVCATLALARRWKSRGVDVNCVHPGGIRTSLFRQYRPPLSWLLWLSDLLKRSTTHGAKGLVHLAIDDSMHAHTGQYFVGSRVATPSKRARDPALQERVWAESARRCGIELTDPSLN